MKKKAGVFIVDDHLLFIQGLVSLLDDMKDVMVMGHAKSIADAVLFCKDHQPDLILMDHYLPDGTGIDAAKQLIRHDPNLKIIILTMAKDRQIMNMARNVGVKAYLLKDIGREELQEHITIVMNGGTIFSGMDTVDSNMASKTADMLSKREKEIALMVGRGMTTLDIARALNISEFTVSTHRKNIMRKLEIKGAVQLARIADLILKDNKE
jgi:DNA-binding NarL/FixJ family response regulator